ncbi:MAG: hypothetical protein R2695_04755 [Acidimicrobiales bacterium]
MWLWDSCFHSLVWLALGEADCGLVELSSALSTVDGAGVRPHMGYQRSGQIGRALGSGQGIVGTQPPMFRSCGGVRAGRGRRAGGAD